MDFVLSLSKDEFGLIEFDGTCLFEYSDPFKQEHKGWGTRVLTMENQVKLDICGYALLEYYHRRMRLDAVASMLYLDYDRKQGNGCNELGSNPTKLSLSESLTKAVLSKYPDIT